MSRYEDNIENNAKEFATKKIINIINKKIRENFNYDNLVLSLKQLKKEIKQESKNWKNQYGKSSRI